MLNLPHDAELQQIVDRPFAAKDSVTDRNVVFMAKEILEYHKLVDMLKKVLLS